MNWLFFWILFLVFCLGFCKFLYGCVYFWVIFFLCVVGVDWCFFNVLVSLEGYVFLMKFGLVGFLIWFKVIGVLEFNCLGMGYCYSLLWLFIYLVFVFVVNVSCLLCVFFFKGCVMIFCEDLYDWLVVGIFILCIVGCLCVIWFWFGLILS